MSYFYSHLINIELLFSKLEDVELREEQRAHLAALIDSTIYHAVLDTVLSHLKKEDKMIFIEMIRTSNDHGKMMEFLTVKIENIEGKIIETTNNIQAEFIEDLEEVKKHG